MNKKSAAVRLLPAVLLIAFAASAFATDGRYVISRDFTPVLNTADFESVFGGVDGMTVKLDSKGLIREMEFIAFPGTVFEVIASENRDGYEILEVKTNDYVYDARLFIDSRFTDAYDINMPPAERRKEMPGKDSIIARMKALAGSPYMWGGNFAEGVSKMLEYYRPAGEIGTEVKDLWTLKGVDCSGLIYESTGGITPRNTSSLVSYGRGVPVEGKTVAEIIPILEPLDLIVWSGHVIIVLDRDEVIESSPPAGVHTSQLEERLTEVINERTPVDEWGSSKGKRFVVRRWISVENP
ncbi:MAG: peptidoglycan endopeptidase [Ignavibacteria bacterium]|nr:peptidoglycan endopeptidase [Ignavibacteria bacterium]